MEYFTITLFRLQREDVIISSFGKLSGSSGWEAGIARFRRLRRGEAKMEAFSRLLRRWHGVPAQKRIVGGHGGREKQLTGIVRDRTRQAKPEEFAKSDGFKDGVSTAVEITNSVEPFDGQG